MMYIIRPDGELSQAAWLAVGKPRLKGDDVRLIAFQLDGEPAWPLVPATRGRNWINETPERFARRCLPLVMANEGGWFLLNMREVTAIWNGGADPSATIIKWTDSDTAFNPISQFGSGIITWQLPYLFRTPPGWNLLVRGPANWPKDGAYPLEGLVETDWSVATFTVNWMLTRPGIAVTFEAGEPLCMLVPQERRVLEKFHPIVLPIGFDDRTRQGYEDWVASRRRFLIDNSRGGPAEGHAHWEGHYMRGVAPDGRRAADHQAKAKLRSFVSAGELDWEKRQPTMDVGHDEGGAVMDDSQRAATLARVDEVTKVVRAVEKKVRFPIRTFNELAEALGGDDAEVTYEGRRRKVGHVRRMIPADYFPIDSPEELITRIADLQARAQPGWPGEVGEGTKLDTVPDDAGTPTDAANYKPGKAHGSGPAVKGWKKE